MKSFQLDLGGEASTLFEFYVSIMSRISLSEYPMNQEISRSFNLAILT